MDGVERSGRQEVEGAGDTQVDPMMHERLVGEVSDVDPDGPRPEFPEQSAHPRLERCGRSARGRRPARVRPAGDVEDGLSADRREWAEGVDQATHELRHDRPEGRLRRDLRRQAIPAVELPESAAQQRSVGGSPTESGQALKGVRRQCAAYAPRPSASSYARASRDPRSSSRAGRRSDVRGRMEEIVRVVRPLDRRQPRERLGVVGGGDLGRIRRFEEVEVGAP